MDEFAWRMKVFSDRWKLSYKVDYLPTSADNNQLGRYLNQLKKQPKEIQERDLRCWQDTVDRFISDRKAFTIDRSFNHSLHWLLTRGVNMYRGRPRKSLEEIRAEQLELHKKIRAQERRESGQVDLFGRLAEEKSMEKLEADDAAANERARRRVQR